MIYALGGVITIITLALSQVLFFLSKRLLFVTSSLLLAKLHLLPCTKSGCIHDICLNKSCGNLFSESVAEGGNIRRTSCICGRWWFIIGSPLFILIIIIAPLGAVILIMCTLFAVELWLYVSNNTDVNRSDYITNCVISLLWPLNKQIFGCSTVTKCHLLPNNHLRPKLKLYIDASSKSWYW